MAAIAYVEDLENLVLSILVENKRYLFNTQKYTRIAMHVYLHNTRSGRLTWHDGMIPSEEIWLKIGGDKGGGSFKMSLQIANVLHPNSTLNTVVFCAFEASDTTSNLHIALDRYTQQVKDLNNLKWE